MIAIYVRVSTKEQVIKLRKLERNLYKESRDYSLVEERIVFLTIE